MNQKGFVNILIGVVVAVVVIGATGYFFIAKEQPKSPQQLESTKSAPVLPISEPKKTEPTIPPQEPKQTPKTPESGKPTLFFVKPKGNISANPGETISIEMRGAGLSEVVLVGPEFAESKKGDGTGIFVFTYRVPTDAIGKLKLSAAGRSGEKLRIARDAAGNFKLLDPLDKSNAPSFVGSDDLTINISLASAGKVVSIRVFKDDIILFGVGDTEQLKVYGTFSDGVERDITSTSLGTEYILYPGQPLNTEIIRVDAEGKVTAVNPGHRSIVITHKDYLGNAISVPVEVGPLSTSDYLKQ